MNKNNLSIYLVGVYVLLFAFAIWSIIPAASTGANLASNAVQGQLAACAPDEVVGGGQAGMQLPFTEQGPVTPLVQTCALMTGGSYN